MNIARWQLLVVMAKEVLINEWPYGEAEMGGGDGYIYRLFTNHAKYDPRFRAEGLYADPRGNYPGYKGLVQYKAIMKFLDDPTADRAMQMRSFDSQGFGYTWLENHVRRMQPVTVVAGPGFIPQIHFSHELGMKQAQSWLERCRQYAKMLHQAGRDGDYQGSREEPRSLAFRPQALTWLALSPRRQNELGLDIEPTEYQRTVQIPDVIKRYPQYKE